MKNTAIVAIIAVVVIAAAVAIYGAVAKTTTETEVGGTSTEVGGVKLGIGNPISLITCKILKLDC